MKAGLKKFWNVFTTVLVVVVVILAVLLVGVRIVGYTPYAVLSPSMMPQYQVGDLVYVKETAFEEIQTGDVITFVADENLTLVTHRVVEVDDGNRTFYTQGDANDIRDGAPVLYENVVGVVRFSLPKLGYISAYIATQSGRYVAIAAVAALLLLTILPEFFKKEKKQENA